MLRPTPGDPWGVEQHHWNTGAEENQQLNLGGVFTFFFKPPCSMNKIKHVKIKNLTCNDITTVCICYVLLILLLYFLSCPYSAWTNANCLASLFLHLPKIMDKKKEHLLS